MSTVRINMEIKVQGKYKCLLMENKNICTICLEKINIGDQTWTCSQCNQVFHLDCKQSWEIISPGEIFKCPHCKYECNRKYSK